MKTMTCKQLGGPCEFRLRGDTADAVIKAQDRHLEEMVAGGDDTHGGGRVAWVAVSARSKRAYRSTTLYRHESTLRLSAEALGLTTFPNHSAGAPDMAEFFEP